MVSVAASLVFQNYFLISPVHLGNSRNSSSKQLEYFLYPTVRDLVVETCCWALAAILGLRKLKIIHESRVVWIENGLGLTTSAIDLEWECMWSEGASRYSAPPRSEEKFLRLAGRLQCCLLFADSSTKMVSIFIAWRALFPLLLVDVKWLWQKRSEFSSVSEMGYFLCEWL